MQHESDKDCELNIESTDENFNYWINQPFISSKTKDELARAEILLVPEIGFRDQEIPVFPVKTEELFNYLKNNSENSAKIDICIEDNNYKELALHYDLITIASFIVTSVALPVFVNLLSNYIKNKLKNGNSDRAIKVSFVVQKKNGDSQKIIYEGKPNNFEDTIKSIKNIWNP